MKTKNILEIIEERIAKLKKGEVLTLTEKEYQALKTSLLYVRGEIIKYQGIPIVIKKKSDKRQILQKTLF